MTTDKISLALVLCLVLFLAAWGIFGYLISTALESILLSIACGFGGAIIATFIVIICSAAVKLAARKILR